MAIIEVKDLSKNYRSYKRRDGVWGGFRDLFHRNYFDVPAVDSISFSVERGELIGYIGPNGAGKSTSIKMLTGILKPSSGKIEVDGMHPFYQRKIYTKNIGVVFGQRTQLWWDIAVIESFRLLAKIYQVDSSDFQKRLDTLSDILELSELLQVPVRKLSLGQRMRCDLAASLLHNPRLLFLDEPTIGLDVIARDRIRTFLRQINIEFSTTIILTTHDLKEIEELCNRIIVLDKGHIIYDGSLSDVKSMPGLRRSIILDFPGDAPLEELRQLLSDQVELTLEGKRRLIGSFSPDVIPAAELIRKVLGKYDVADLKLEEPSIDDVIVKLYTEGVNA